ERPPRIEPLGGVTSGGPTIGDDAGRCRGTTGTGTGTCTGVAERRGGRRVTRSSMAPVPDHPVIVVICWHAPLRVPLPRVRRHLRGQPPDERVRRARAVSRRAYRHGQAAVHRGP